jgi:hypothetical protein
MGGVPKQQNQTSGPQLAQHPGGDNANFPATNCVVADGILFTLAASQYPDC